MLLNEIFTTHIVINDSIMCKMMCAVKFYAKFDFRSIKIQHIRTYAKLTTKLNPTNLSRL